MLIRPDETIKPAESDEPTAAPVAGSPLIDAAVLLPNVNEDFEGNGPDIGPRIGKPGHITGHGRGPPALRTSRSTASRNRR